MNFDEEIEAYLKSNSLVEQVLVKNELSGYEYSSYRKEGLSLQAFLLSENTTSYIIVDLYWAGDAQYRLRAIRYIEGRAGSPEYKRKILYLEGRD